MKSLIKIPLAALVLLASFKFFVAQDTVPGLTGCLLPTNSPQFALLCNLLNGTNAALPLYGGYTADQVCDGDCRCVMGATVRGGKCGPRPSDGQMFCMCDYATTPARKPLLLTQVLNCVGFDILLSLCSPPNILNRLCNSDCICSHGYPNTSETSGVCSVNSAVSGNSKPYCFCNNGTNL